MTTTFAPPAQACDTSRAAANAITDKMSSLQMQVMLYLDVHGPSTDDDMQHGLNMNPSTQRPRRIELVAAGLVRDSGTTRKTRTGRAATVWEVV